MRVIESVVNHPADEGVILEYVKYTRDFAEIKEYVKYKGDTIRGYTQNNECVFVRIEDILYYETFAYTSDKIFKLDGRLYQVEENVARSYICRASKTMFVNMNKIESVQTALNGRLYAKMEKEEAEKINRKIAKYRKKKASECR